MQGRVVHTKRESCYRMTKESIFYCMMNVSISTPPDCPCYAALPGVEGEYTRKLWSSSIELASICHRDDCRDCHGWVEAAVVAKATLTHHC